MSGMKDTLGDIPYRPHGPGFKERGGTSEQAAKVIRSRAGTLRASALAAIETAPFGLTADEIAFALNESVLAIRPRVSELWKAGAIQTNGVRRKNTSGTLAAVWVTIY